MEITSMNHAMQLHAQLVKSGSKSQQDLSKLFTFVALSPAADLSYARLLLWSLPSPSSYYFNTMLRAYSQSPDPTQALSLFLSMHLGLTHFPRPDNFTYPFLLKSCARLRLTHFGKQLHGLILKSNFGSDLFVVNSLIRMYLQCGDTSLAYIVFGKMSDRDVVSWTSMIDGLVENDMSVEAIRLFEVMLEDGIEGNDATVVSVLKACADTGALSVGKRVHGLVEDRELSNSKANVNTALIDMYAKCGCITSAKRVFDEILNKDIFAWTAIISGLASHGQCKEAIDLFDKMKQSNVKPDERTMTAVLSACRNAGWVAKGYSYLNGMRKMYGVKPSIQHYGCMVDLLARAGHLKEAEEFIRTMPIEPDDVLWRSLIWGCKVHGDTTRSERLIEHIKLVKKVSNDIGSYVLVGNVYASAGKWKDKAKVRELMNQKGLIKPAGCSKIEINGVIHEFAAGDSTHPEAESIYRKLDEINLRLGKEGYTPKLSVVLLEIDDYEKTFQLRHHSEKLAVAFGLIKTSFRSEIRIVKNLRSCEDCHEVMKLISRMYQREIVMRDRIRFHHFRNGDCSCGDYW